MTELHARSGERERTSPLAMSRVVPALVLLLVAVPYGQIFMLRLGFVTLDAFEILHLLIGGLCTILLVFNGIRLRFAPLLALWCGLSAAHLAVSPLVLDVTFKEALVQYRSYLPFLVAVLILAVPWKPQLDRFARGLVRAAAVSAGTILLLHFVFPSVLERSLAHSEVVAAIVLEHGRLYWLNALVSIFVVGMLFTHRTDRTVNWVAFGLASVACAATVSRTIVAGLLLMGWSMLVFGRNISRWRRLRLAVGSAIVLMALGAVLFRASEQFAGLSTARVTGRALYEEAFVFERMPIYEQYWRSIASHFPLGQGLGMPFSSNFREDLFITDISVVAFLIPFGMLGLLTFVYFIYVLFRSIRASEPRTESERAVRRFLPHLVFTLTVLSLNLDVFSRNNAVIWLAMLVGLLTARTRYAPALELEVPIAQRDPEMSWTPRHAMGHPATSAEPWRRRRDRALDPS